MNTVSQKADRGRYTALKLLSLGWLDRRWVMARLPAEERARLSGYLKELRRNRTHKLDYQQVTDLLNEYDAENSAVSQENIQKENVSEEGSSAQNDTLIIPKGMPAQIVSILHKEAQSRHINVQHSVSKLPGVDVSLKVQELLFNEFVNIRSRERDANN